MHTVYGKINKETYRKEGCGKQQTSVMYIINLSEKTTDFQTGQDKWTNYKAMIFASSPKQISFYDQITAKGGFVVLSSEKLSVEQNESNGVNYITLNMENARLVSAYTPENGQPQQQQQQQHQPIQQQPQQYQAQPEPEMDFDEDIPF